MECEGKEVKDEIEKQTRDYRGSPEEVTGEVQRLLNVMVSKMKRRDIQKALALRHEDYFREAYLVPALTAGVNEMTIPGKPTSSKQKYRLTEKGRGLVVKLGGEGEKTRGKKGEGSA